MCIDSFDVLSAKKIKNIWSVQKKVVPLHAFSAFGLPSSAAEGTDDTIVNCQLSIALGMPTSRTPHLA